jgi:hypothetical protein
MWPPLRASARTPNFNECLFLGRFAFRGSRGRIRSRIKDYPFGPCGFVHDRRRGLNRQSRHGLLNQWRGFGRNEFRPR